MVYLPPAFTETREDVLLAHIERHDFGLLVTHGTAGLIASQIPFLAERRDGKFYLQAHIARVNPQEGEQITAEGKADAVLLARAMLRDPYWPLHAAKALGVDVPWPQQYVRAKD